MLILLALFNPQDVATKALETLLRGNNAAPKIAVLYHDFHLITRCGHGPGVFATAPRTVAIVSVPCSSKILRPRATAARVTRCMQCTGVGQHLHGVV